MANWVILLGNNWLFHVGHKNWKLKPQMQLCRLPYCIWIISTFFWSRTHNTSKYALIFKWGHPIIVSMFHNVFHACPHSIQESQLVVAVRMRACRQGSWGMLWEVDCVAGSLEWDVDGTSSSTPASSGPTIQMWSFVCISICIVLIIYKKQAIANMKLMK